MRRPIVKTFLLALAISLAAAAPAGAATKIDLGLGTLPEVVAGPDGAVHMLNRTEPGDGVIYCRVPRRGRGCDVRTPLPIGGSAQYSALYRRGDGLLIAVQTVEDTESSPLDGQDGVLYASFSSDNGATFTPPAVIATGIDDFFPVELSPDGQAIMLMYNDTDGALLRRAPFQGTDTRTLNVEDTSGATSGVSLAHLPGGRMLLARTGSDDIVAWRVFGGGDPLDINAWPTRGELTDAFGTWMVSGPRGVFLRTSRGFGEQFLESKAPIALRSFDSKNLRWRAPHAALTDQIVYGGSSIYQDAGGRLHVATVTNGYSGRGCVMYARTGRKSSQWFGRTTRLFATRYKTQMPTSAVIAAGPDGNGLAVWVDTSAHVWATPLRQAKGRARTISVGARRQNCGYSR
jgi:hypothetical protein